MIKLIGTLRHIVSQYDHTEGRYQVTNDIQTWVFLVLRLLRYLEAQNDGPNETETEPRVSVNDVVGSHILQMHSLFAQELQRFIHILQAVDTHLAFCWAWLQMKNVM